MSRLNDHQFVVDRIVRLGHYFAEGRANGLLFFERIFGRFVERDQAKQLGPCIGFDLKLKGFGWFVVMVTAAFDFIQSLYATISNTLNALVTAT